MPHLTKHLGRAARGSPRFRAAAVLASDRSGATAAEFALLAIPFLMLIFALLEIGLLFILSLNLSNASATVGRQIRVGSLVATGVGVNTSNGAQMDLQDFKTALCSNIQLVPKSLCLSQIQVDVRTVNDFQSGTQFNPISGRTFNQASLCFYSGVPGSIVEMHTYYLWPIVTPYLLSMFVNVTGISGASGTSNGAWSAANAVEVFVNEPNTSVTNPGSGC